MNKFNNENINRNVFKISNIRLKTFKIYGKNIWRYINFLAKEIILCKQKHQVHVN